MIKSNVFFIAKIYAIYNIPVAPIASIYELLFAIVLLQIRKMRWWK